MSLTELSSSLDTRKRYLAIPLSLYLFLSILYLFAIPPGESPDEPGHVQCIEQVAEDNRLPIVAPKPTEGRWWERGNIISGYVCYHMPLYYILSGYLEKGIAAIEGTNIHFEFPPSNPNFSLADPPMFVHENKRSFWHISEPITMVGLRLLSIGLGSVTVWASYIVALRLFPDRQQIAILAAVIVAGWPQFVYLSRSINNDVLATALTVLTLVVLLDVGRASRFPGAALSSALALLAKISVAFTVIVVIIAWGLEFAIMGRRNWTYVRALLISLAIWGSMILLLTQNPVLSLHYSQSTRAFSAVSQPATTIKYWQDVFLITLSSGWARIGWMNIPAPEWHAYVWWATISLAGIAGFRIIWKTNTGRKQRTLLLILLVWLSLLLSSYVRINVNRFQPQFRVAMASISVFSSLAAGGFLYWTRHRTQLAWGIIFSAIGFLLMYNIWFVFTTIRTAYGWVI